MKLVVDMSLSPDWCAVLRSEGWDAVHWSQVGDPQATDAQVMAWAAGEGRIVLTHDLDFGAILAATRAQGPSVVQVRAQDVLPKKLAPLLIPALRQVEQQLVAGALVVIDEGKLRVRVLPLD